jgi:signal transduction histidine kinase
MYEIECASSGEEVLLKMESFRPEVMLLDVNMPGMSGYDVCRIIREREESRMTRVLLVSANMSIDERMRGYRAGADDYVMKPFSPEELRAKVEVFLKLKSEEEVDDAKSNLIGLFTHETRTPLGVIIGLSDLLRVDDGKDGETRQCAQAIFENAVRLHRFIEKSTLLSKLKGGYSPICVASSFFVHLQRIIRRLESEAEEKQVRITVENAEDIEMNIDWEIFDEALGYIVENAVEYSSQGGTVEIESHPKGDRFEISVTDQGKGITASWIGNIFDEFAIRDIKHHRKGQGLSLSVSKKVVELLGGKIQVTSRTDKGSQFLIQLPLNGGRINSKIS